MKDAGPRRAQASSSRRVYEVLLAAYPRRFRDRHGREMADVFEDERLERIARSGRKAGLLGAWVWALADLARGALAERSGSVMRSYGLVRWGGTSAVAGGVLIAAAGLAYSTVGNGGYNTPMGLAFLLMVLQGLGTVLVLAGLLGLVRLIERRGVLPAMPTARDAVTGARGVPERIGWTQRCAAWGLVVAAVSALTATTELVWIVISEGAVGGFAAGAWGAVADVLAVVLGVSRIFGLPLATALLGIAAWRSGVLGRWRSLPLAVALLASPLLTMAMALVVIGAAGVPAESVTMLDHLLIFGLPAVLAGAGWALLGSVLASGTEPRRGVQDA